MASPRTLRQVRSTLKLPQGRSNPGPAPANPPAASTSSRSPPAPSSGLQELISQTLWPMVDAAFRNVEEQVEARFFQVADLQVVISRASARAAGQRDGSRRVTLELWPLAGPRVLVVDWSGRRPYIVYQRDGDWLERLVQGTRQAK